MKTVNFIEAVNSGKKICPIDYSQFYYTVKDLLGGDYTIQELVNSKFILEEKEITITESQFDKAWNLASTEAFANFKSIPHTIKKELGF
jgi:hypothetical protein